MKEAVDKEYNHNCSQSACTEKRCLLNFCPNHYYIESMSPPPLRKGRSEFVEIFLAAYRETPYSREEMPMDSVGNT